MKEKNTIKTKTFSYDKPYITKMSSTYQENVPKDNKLKGIFWMYLSFCVL